MTAAVADIPAAVRGVPSRPGTYRRPCPYCRKGKGDDALAITVDRDGGVVWLCHRCEAKGSTRGRSTAPHRDHRDQRDRDRVQVDHDDTERKRRSAQRLIRDSQLATSTLVETYLAHRGLALPGDAPLFFHPRAFHWPSGTRQPAMVVPIQGVETNRLQGAHLTFLSPDGKGKAHLDKPRLYLGPKSGGAVKLTPDPDVTYGLCVTEGVETGLAALMASYPTWAVLDAGNLENLPVLNGIDALTVAADHDERGLQAARRVMARWRKAGKEVREFVPPRRGHDLNDHVRAGEVADA